MNIDSSVLPSINTSNYLSEKEDVIDPHNPFDMHQFWKNIDSYGFEPKLESINYLNIKLLIYKFAREEAQKYRIDTHFVAPKNVLLTIPKSLERLLESDAEFLNKKLYYMKFYEQKNISPLKERNFLMEMKEKEEKNIEEKLRFIEDLIEKDRKNSGILNENIFIKRKKGRPRKNAGNYFVNFDLRHILKLSLEKPLLSLEDRLDLLFGQICDLQLKQLAECICGVLRNKDNQTYKILMDLDSKIHAIEMSKEQYMNFIKYRDPLNSISDYDLFQEKTHCYFNTDTKAKSFIDYEDLEGTDNENKRNNRIKMRAILYKTNSKNKKRGVNSKKELREEYHTGKKVKVEYFYCHHCKQRKPEEVTIQCKSHMNGDGYCHKPHKVFTVNGSTIIRSKC